MQYCKMKYKGKKIIVSDTDKKGENCRFIHLYNILIKSENDINSKNIIFFAKEEISSQLINHNDDIYIYLIIVHKFTHFCCSSTRKYLETCEDVGRFPRTIRSELTSDVDITNYACGNVLFAHTTFHTRYV